VPSDFLSVLDKPPAFRVEAAEKYAPYLKKLCHKHLQKSAELAFAQKREYPTLFDNRSTVNVNPFSATNTTTVISDPSPNPTRGRAAPLPGITHQLPAFKRQRLDAPDPPIQLPNPPPIDPRDRLHDREADHASLSLQLFFAKAVQPFFELFMACPLPSEAGFKRSIIRGSPG
jgi:hypothetical protein